jgi:hypothetical protein
MGYRKVYLTIEEEEDIESIKNAREKEGREGAAYNAILKEGLAMVMDKELTLRVQGRTEVVSEANEKSQTVRSRRGRRQHV